MAKTLSLGESWAVAITLRLLVLENLRRLVTLIVDADADRGRAEQVADRLLGTGGREREPISRVIPGAEGVRPSRAFAVRLIQRLKRQQASRGHRVVGSTFVRGLAVAALIGRSERPIPSTFVVDR